MFLSEVSPVESETFGVGDRGFGASDPVCLTLTPVPEVLIWPHALTHKQALFSSFSWCSLSSASAWRTLGSTPLNCFSVTSAPCPHAGWIHLVPHAPLPHHHCTGCSSGLLWFSFLFSSASTDRALAWLPASWQEQHVKCRPGRGMEWRGAGFLSASPS